MRCMNRLGPGESAECSIVGEQVIFVNFQLIGCNARQESLEKPVATAERVSAIGTAFP